MYHPIKSRIEIYIHIVSLQYLCSNIGILKGYLLLTLQIQILEEPLEVMSSPHHILSTHRTVHNSGITGTTDKVTFRALEHSGLSSELDQTNGTLTLELY